MYIVCRRIKEDIRTLYDVHFTTYIVWLCVLRAYVQRILYGVQCTVYTVHCTVYSLQCTPYNNSPFHNVKRLIGNNESYVHHVVCPYSSLPSLSLHIHIHLYRLSCNTYVLGLMIEAKIRRKCVFFTYIQILYFFCPISFRKMNK